MNEPSIFVAVKASETRFLTALKIIVVNRRLHQLLGNECPGEVVGEMAILQQQGAGGT